MPHRSKFNGLSFGEEAKQQLIRVSKTIRARTSLTSKRLTLLLKCKQIQIRARASRRLLNSAKVLTRETRTRGARAGETLLEC
jgi:hypothetical protein